MWRALLPNVIFWGVIVLGLTASIYLVTTTFYILVVKNQEPSQLSTLPGKSAERGQYVYTQHASLKVGPLEVQFFPRLGAALVVSAGIVLLITGLFVLLHVPTTLREL